MVAQLHELSIIESPEFNPSLEPFMPSELIQEIAQTFRLKATEKSIRDRLS